MADLYFDDVEIGLELPKLKKGPISSSHIMRWSAASENWHRIHYDWRYATEHDNLPDIMVNGSWKQNFLIQLVTDWVGESGWVWKLGFQFRGMNVPGETLVVWGTVTAKEERGDYGLISVKIGLVNDKGEESTPGSALVVLAKRGGPKVPYPFNPKVIPAAAAAPEST